MTSKVAAIAAALALLVFIAVSVAVYCRFVLVLKSMATVFAWAFTSVVIAA